MTNLSLILCGLLAAGLIASLLLFLSLKQELRASLRAQHQRFEEIALRIEKAPEPVALALPELPRPTHAGFNLNRRVYAMRMVRRGEDVAHIAAALGVPRAEVELLIRVQRLSALAGGAVRISEGA